MKPTMRIALALLLPALLAHEAAAQWNVARFDRAPNRAYTSFGLDPAFVTTVGYGRVVPIFGHKVQFAGDVGIGTAGMDFGDFRARLEGFTSIVHWRSVHLTGSATFITRGTENAIYRGLNFGSDFTGAAGVYRPAWFMAGEFGFDKAIITHITHTDWYRTYFYPDAKDGWYLDTGGTFHYGVAAGVAIGRVELAGRFGWQRTEDFNDLASPFYGTLGAGFRF
jgi:hypothetical protein